MHEPARPPWKSVLYEVGLEREKQTRKWGTQGHGMPVWLAILGEEFGELCQAALRARTTNAPMNEQSAEEMVAHQCSLRDMRVEAIQVAAVAVAMIEAIDDQRADVGRYEPGDIETEARP